MAIVVESVSAFVSGFGTSSDPTITKPTGVQVGDILIAVLQGSDVDLGNVVGMSWDTLSGWTEAIGQAGGRSFNSIQYRVATAADVSATDYSFSYSGGGDSGTYGSGYMMRCSGVTPDDLEVLGVGGSTALSYTPPTDGCLSVLTAFGLNNSIPTNSTITGYTTSGVSYTEKQQTFLGDGTPGAVQGSAYGVQATAEEITTFGATYSFSPTIQENLIAVFLPPVDATGTNTLAETTAEALAQTGTCDTVGASSFEETDTESFTQSGKATSPQQWTNEAKPSTTWENEQK